MSARHPWPCSARRTTSFVCGAQRSRQRMSTSRPAAVVAVEGAAKKPFVRSFVRVGATARPNTAIQPPARPNTHHTQHAFSVRFRQSTMRTTTAPIRFKRSQESQERPFKLSEDVLSKSWGAYPGHKTVLQR